MVVVVVVVAMVVVVAGGRGGGPLVVVVVVGVQGRPPAGLAKGWGAVSAEGMRKGARRESYTFANQIPFAVSQIPFSTPGSPELPVSRLLSVLVPKHTPH